MKENFIVECNVCKQRYENWYGSTPCCGSIAFLLNKEGSTSNKVGLYASVGVVMLDFSEKENIK